MTARRPSARWLPLLVVAGILVVGAIGLRAPADPPGAGVTSLRPDATGRVASPSTPTSGSGPDACATVRDALLGLMTRDPTSGPGATADAGATSGAAVLRSALPPELVGAFDRWWSQVERDSGTGAVAPVPEIDAWFERTCPARGP